MHTPDYPLMLSRASAGRRRARPRPHRERRSGRRIPGVNAGQEAADAFAAAWRDRTGDAVAVYRRMRLFRLGELIPPRPAARGDGQARRRDRP